ncbi:hypothetical protein [Thalassospira povalilytica]|uniref:Uncharacterized protein n=1 Tax=Thalassospira povalilytica TaxID=732237 RepID=A0ABX4R4F4_9PROT|nr:hypothetical protein [Thalassospira povalilytica]MCC4241140.1 hypothetical protein [Thalassospira povalilytica]PKR47843.1 hypothetical protein CU041_17320 [Thalassospira povalilytica]
MGTPEKFTEAMFANYRAAKAELGYNATYFLKMLNDRKGVGTARALLASPRHHDGYTELYKLQRLDLSVEALVLNEEWRDLFLPEELDIARNRLREAGCDETGRSLKSKP